MEKVAYHGLLASRHVVVRKRKHVDEECADDDDRGGEDDAVDEALAYDRLVLTPWRFLHDRRIYGIYSQRLARWA